MSIPLLWILKALLSHYWRRPWQTIFLLLGLVSGVGLWSAVQIINQHAQDSYQQAQSLLGVQANYWIQSRDQSGVDQTLYIELRRSGYRQIFPLVEFEVSTPDGIAINVIATDLLALSGSQIFQDEEEQNLTIDWSGFVQPPFQAWYAPELAEEIGIEEGVSLLLRDGRLLPPALLQNRQHQGRSVLIDIAAAFELTDKQNFTYLAVGQITTTESMALAQRLPKSLELVKNSQHIDLKQLTDSLHTHLTAMSLLSFAVGLFIVFNAVRFSLWYRKQTIMILRSLGSTVRQVILALAVETLIWSFLGAVFGFALGFLFAQLLLPGVGASLQSLYSANLGTVISIDPWAFTNAWAITLIGLSFALFWPMYQQLRLSVSSASDSDEMFLQEKLARKRLVFTALILSLLSCIFYFYVENIDEGFLLLGLMLFSAVWALPFILASALHALNFVLPKKYLLSRWMVSDGWSQLPIMRSAMMALILALTANIGVGILVDSFRHAFVDWLQVRQSADIYLRASNADYQQLINAKNSLDWLVDTNLRVGVNTRWRGRTALIHGADPYAPDSLQIPLSKWIGDSPQSALRTWREKPDMVLVNEQVHYLMDVQIGQSISLDSDYGPIQYTVAGVFYDYGNPHLQFDLPIEEVQAHWKNQFARGIALWLKDKRNETFSRADAGLRAFGFRPADWILQSEMRTLSLGIFDRTFAITAAMNALTMIIAAIAMMASLLAILQNRLPQFAQWRAFGLSQKELLLLIATPLLLFSLIVWVLSLPLGALLSWVLIHKLNIISFGWSMPLLWRFSPALFLGAVVLLIVLLSLLLVGLQWRRKMPAALAQLGENL